MKKSIAALISFYVFVSSLFSYTYSGSNNLRSDCASWQVADERMETFWQLAENEEEGFIQITGPEEKKEKIIISAEIAEKSRLQLYTLGGMGYKAISSCVKEGPFSGTFEFNLISNITQKNRESDSIILKVEGEKAYETKIFEIECISLQNENFQTEEWGKIKPYEYEININENINLKAERLWDGKLDGAWFEPEWYIPWEITNESKINRTSEIFSNVGYPQKDAQIIWNLDGLYEIEIVKAFIQTSWRCIQFEYEHNGKWEPLAVIGPLNQKDNSWNRVEVNNVITDKLRISFPNGWEQARFISEVELWGKRCFGKEKTGCGEIELYGEYDVENNNAWYVFDSRRTDGEIEVTYIGVENTIPVAKINEYQLPVIYETTANGNKVCLYSIDKEWLRTDKQFLCINNSKVASVIYRNKQDNGKLTEINNAVIERIIAKDSFGNVSVINGHGKNIDEINLDYYDEETVFEYYGSKIKDEKPSFELYRPLSLDTEWKGSIIGITGNSNCPVNIQGYGVRREDRCFWIPQSEIDFYNLKGYLKFQVGSDNLEQEYIYPIKGGKKQKGGELGCYESLEYTDTDSFEITGTLKDKNSKVYVNGKELHNNNYSFVKNVSLKPGFQTIIVEVKKNETTVAYWTKDIYRFFNEGIKLTLFGSESEISTIESEYTLSGKITNANNPSVYLNGKQIVISQGFFSETVSLEEGENLFVLSVEDENGRLAEKEIRIVKDTTSPVVEVIYPENNSYISSSEIEVHVKADEKDYWYSINDEPFEYCSTVDYKKIFVLDEGYYNWNLKVMDKAGNIAETEPIQFCIDVTSPETFQIIPNKSSSIDKWCNDNNITVMFNTTDAISQIEKYEYSLGDSEWKVCESPLVLDPLSDGIHNLFVKAVDKANNYTIENLNIYVDITAPERFELEANVEKEVWKSINEIIPFFATKDETSGIEKNTLILDDGEEIEWESGRIIENLPDGKHTIVITAYDKAGNYTKNKAEYWLDITPPNRIDYELNISGWSNNNKPVLQFVSEDKCSGIMKYEIKVDNSDWFECTNPYRYSELTEGIHTSQIRTFDYAGNKTETEIFELKIDTIPPVEVTNCRLISGNGEMEGIWETSDNDIIAYHITIDYQNENKIQKTIQEQSIKINNISNGTVVRLEVFAEDKAHNFGPVTKTSLTMSGIAIVPVIPDELTVVEYENIKMIIPVQEEDSNLVGVIVNERKSEYLEEASINPIVSPIYSFTALVSNGDGTIDEKEHYLFNEPVILFIDYDETKLPQGFPENNVEAYYFDNFWGKWFRAENAAVDTEQNRIMVMTNHFTDFSVQPTLLSDLTPEELKTAGHAYGNTETNAGGVTVSSEGGAVITESTEFVIHGKNGFEFPIKRIYDSQTSKADGPSINAALSLGFNLSGLSGINVLKDIVNSGISFLTADLKNRILKAYQRNGDYNLGMGAGWRLGLPYIYGDNSGMIIRMPNGSYYQINQMELKSEEINDFLLNVTYENHRGDDFTVIVRKTNEIIADVINSVDTGDFSSIIASVLGDGIDCLGSNATRDKILTKITGSLNIKDIFIKGLKTVTSLGTVETEIIIKDGTTYIYNGYGRIKEIRDLSGTNVISFVYNENTRFDSLIDYIEDPFGNRIKFEYNTTEDVFLRPYITKIRVPYTKDEYREWNYKYNSSRSSNFTNLLFYTMPELIEAEDSEKRKSIYEYNTGIDTFLINGGASAKINVLGAVGDIFGLGDLMSFLNIKTITLSGRIELDWPALLTKAVLPENGETVITYDIQDMTAQNFGFADYLFGCKWFPTAVKIDLSFYQKALCTETLVKNGINTLKTNYKYDTEVYKGQHFTKRSEITNDNTKTVNEYAKKEYEYLRIGTLSDYVDEMTSGTLFFTETNTNETAIYSQLQSTSVYKKTANGTFESSPYEKTEYKWDDKHNRLTEEKSVRGSVSQEKSMSYDDWGNITSEAVTQKSKQGQTVKKTETVYYGSNSNITDFPQGIKSTVLQSNNSRVPRNLPIQQSVNDGYLTVYTGYAYDGYGRNVWSGIYDDNGNWAYKTTEYQPVTGNNKETDGLVKHTVSAEGQEVDYSYNIKDENLITTILFKDVVDYEGNKKDITNKSAINCYTRWTSWEEDGNGNKTSYEYDKLGRVTKIEHADDSENTIYENVLYDDKKHTITVYKDGSEKPAELYNYDSKHNLISLTKYNYVEKETTGTVKLTYDSFDNVTSLTDQNGNKTSYKYDVLSRMILQTNPDKTTIRIAYNDQDSIRTTTDENGNNVKEKIGYGGLVEKIERIVSDTNITESTVYDGNGRPVRITDALGQVTLIEYSVFGKEKTKTLPSLKVYENRIDKTVIPYIKTKYNKDGLAVEVLVGHSGREKRSSVTYDGLGRKLCETESPADNLTAARTVSYEYDGAGNVIKEIDGEGFVKTYTYTKRNQKKTETNPLGGTTVNTYDRDDNLISMTDPNGSKIEYVYDDFGRIIKAILPDVPGVSERKTVEIVYDSRGNALKMAETGGKTSEWSYDSRNRKLIETVSGEGAVSVVTEWEYDGVGNVIKEIIGRAESKTEYDELNRVVLQEYADGQREIYKYDVLSRVIMTEDAMGVQKSNKYNSLNKVIETIDGLGNSTEYYYDVFGNCTKTTEPNLGGSGEQVWNRNYNVWGQPVTEYNNAGQNWSYEYDKRGFVKKRIEPNGTVTDIVYDGNGNLLSETKILGEKTERKSYSYDAVGFLYNAIDNGIVSIINSAGGQYEPNAWGLVTSIETRQGGKVLLSRYEYDEALNNTKIVYPDGFEVCSGYNGLGQLVKIGDEYNTERFASGGVYNEAGRPVTISAGNGTARTKSWDVNTNLLTGYGWNIDSEKERIIEWNNQGNIVSISGGKKVSYSYDKLSRLVREITDAKVEKSNRKDSGIGEAFTFGYAEADVDGNRSLLYSNQVMKFDYYASSVGASLGGTKLVNEVRLYGNSSRLDEKYMEIYLSSEGLDGSWYKAETFCIEKDESGLKVIFAEPVEAGYVKIHSTWDERDEDYRPVDRSETGGKPYDLLEVFIIQKGRRNEWSYDARGNRVVSTIDNSSLVIEYYNSSDLLRKYGEWYFNYDANGNMIARGRNGTEKTSMASDALFEGYDFSSDKGELWTYEYDLSNRLVKVNYSNNGTNGLKEKTGYLYDYRGLCIAKTSVKGTDYYEYTADGRLIYTERSDYVADYVYSGTSIFAEVRKQNGNDETFYHHTDHLGTTEVITDESGTVVWKASYEAFGSVLCENGTRLFEASFTGKFFDRDIGLYYFNARWYDAETGKFVTQDPARDGINWYAYCLNNPLKYFDPLGLESEEGTTNSNLWENAIDDIENGFRAFGNLDFGTDWRYFAVNSYANGQWLLGSLQELNGITEATMDFVFAKFGALVLGATVGAVGTAYAEKSLTAGYVNFTINTNSLIQDFNNELSETYLSVRNGLANKIIELSFHNKNSLYMTMGPYRNPNVEPYVDIAKSNKDMYFSLGKLWGPIQKTLKYTQNDMFNTFNKPAIDYAVKQGKILRFTMDVRSLKGTSSYLEWDYLKTAYEYTKLEQMEDGFWYAK